jgi:hypothetical protein
MWTSAHTFPNATAAYENLPVHQKICFDRNSSSHGLEQFGCHAKKRGLGSLVSLMRQIVAAVWEVAGRRMEAQIGII